MKTNKKTKYIDGIKWVRDEEGIWWTPDTNAYCLDCEEFVDENGKHSHLLKFDKKLKK